MSKLLTQVQTKIFIIDLIITIDLLSILNKNEIDNLIEYVKINNINLVNLSYKDKKIVKFK